MTRERFDAQIGRLIVLRGWPDDVAEFWTALKDVPEDVFTAACDHALKTRSWFPAPAELRMDCDVVTVDRRASAAVLLEPQMREVAPRVLEIPNPFDGGAPLRIRITREWSHDCDTCADSGWASRWCGPKSEAHPDGTHCGRRQEHVHHAFVEACACREWNPTIRRHRDAMTKFSKAPERAA